jgi:hypothetical protein
MPQTVYCGKCNHIIYSGLEIKPPTEIIQAKGGLCPKCDKRWNFEIGKVEVIPIDTC